MEVRNSTYNLQEIGLAKALVRKGHVCDVLFWTNQEEKTINICFDKDHVVKVFYRHGLTFLKNTIYYKCKSLFESYDVLQTVEYNQIESWHLAKLFPNKVIIYHGPYYSNFNKNYNRMCKAFDLLFLKRYIKYETKFITKSNFAEAFLSSKGINKSNIHALGVGIDVDALCSNVDVCNEPIYQRMNSDRSVKLLYIGRFDKRRNIHFILDVFATLLRTRHDITLYMIGSGEKEYVESCWDYAKKLGISNSIVYQDKMEQKYLSFVYQKADFFLLPTLYEIFGMVLLESMFFGVVPLTTMNGGSDMLIENGENGFIINVMDPDIWANTISNVIINKEKLNIMKNKASDTIRKNFTWDALANRFIYEYKALRNNC